MKLNKKQKIIFFIFIPTVIALSIVISLIIWASGVTYTIWKVAILWGVALIIIDVVLYLNTKLKRKPKLFKMDATQQKEFDDKKEEVKTKTEESKVKETDIESIAMPLIFEDSEEVLVQAEASASEEQSAKKSASKKKAKESTPTIEENKTAKPKKTKTKEERIED